MSDLISRQAAIDLISQHTFYDDYDDTDKCSLLDGLRELPSAQPEIIRCKDCDWWTKQEASLQGRCARHGVYPTGEWFCAGAKRRTDETD